MRKFILKSFILIVTMVALVFPTNIAQALSSIDGNKTISLSINHIYNETPLENVNVKLFKVGKFNLDGEFTIEDKFKTYPIDLDKINRPTNWTELADTLQSYIGVDNINEDYNSNTNKEGIANFTSIDKGLYLAICEDSILENKIIKAKPFLISLPSKDLSTDEYIYNVDSKTKNDSFEDEKVDITVQKVWENEEDKSKRPEYITINLYKDNKEYDSVKLNEENQWKYTWTNLSRKNEWNIIEIDINKNYNVTYEKYDKKIIITNTYKPSTEVKPQEPDKNDKLPQTGMLWWPVPILLFTGMTFICIGIITGRKNNN